MRLLTILLVIGFLHGCGGGGSSPTQSTSQSTPTEILSSIDFVFEGSEEKYLTRSMLIQDLDEDGINEVVLTTTSYPNQIPLPVHILGYKNGSIDLTNNFFSSIPKVKHSPFINYKDVTNDGKKDLVFADAGLDKEPWTGTKISVGIKQGDKFVDASSLIQDTDRRNYSLAIGDFNGSKTNQILLSDRDPANKVLNGALMVWNGNRFYTTNNPVSTWNQNKNFENVFLGASDFNNDGYDDLLITGNWVGKTNTIIYGTSTGLKSNEQNVLPSNPFGEGGYDYVYGSVNPWPPTSAISSHESFSLILDIDNDGKKDIVTESIRFGFDPKNGWFSDLNKISIWKNTDGYKFENNQVIDLEYKWTHTMLPFDINQDGIMDFIGYFWNRNCVNSDLCNKTGTLFFINNGKGQFTKYDASDIFPELVTESMVGHIVPISYGSKPLALQILTDDKRKKMTARSFTFDSKKLTLLK